MIECFDSLKDDLLVEHLSYLVFQLCLLTDTELEELVDVVFEGDGNDRLGLQLEESDDVADGLFIVDELVLG